MDGDQHQHAYYREQICDFMRKNREDFEPFIVDQPFDTFVRSLSKDGTYGGNECLVAFSHLFNAKICIHQVIVYIILWRGKIYHSKFTFSKTKSNQLRRRS